MAAKLVCACKLIILIDSSANPFSAISLSVLLSILSLVESVVILQVELSGSGIVNDVPGVINSNDCFNHANSAQPLCLYWISFAAQSCHTLRTVEIGCAESRLL